MRGGAKPKAASPRHNLPLACLKPVHLTGPFPVFSGLSHPSAKGPTDKSDPERTARWLSVVSLLT